MSDLKASIRAMVYDLGPSNWYRSAFRFIVADIELRQGAWLDIGCGPGWLCVLAAEGNPDLDVVGIDTDRAMLQRATAHKGHRLNVTLRSMDAATIVYPDGTFDVVTAVQTAHHWTQTAQILAEVHRVLNEGGRFFLYEANPEAEIPEGWIDREGPWPPEALLRRRWRRFGMDQARWEELKELVRASPFGEDFVDEPHGFYRRLVCTR